jgi:hypothetical protein
VLLLVLPGEPGSDPVVGLDRDLPGLVRLAAIEGADVRQPGVEALQNLG